MTIVWIIVAWIMVSILAVTPRALVSYYDLDDRDGDHDTVEGEPDRDDTVEASRKLVERV